MKIKVCLPYYSHYEPAKPGLDELAFYRKPQFIIDTSECVDPGKGRNIMVSRSQRRIQTSFEYPYYLFIDHDSIFKSLHVLNLLNHNKDIVSGAYCMRHDTRLVNAGYWEKETPGNIERYLTFSTKELQKVDFVGAGFLLVKAEALAKIEYPWFRHILTVKGEYQDEMSSDYGFCMGARKAGIDIFVDCNTIIGHDLNARKTPNTKSLYISTGDHGS